MKIVELLDSPEKWTQNATARTVDGFCVMYDAATAVRFCIIGAMYRCYEYPHRYTVNKKIDACLQQRGITVGIVHWQNAPERTFEEITEILKEADV